MTIPACDCWNKYTGRIAVSPVIFLTLFILGIAQGCHKETGQVGNFQQDDTYIYVPKIKAVSEIDAHLDPSSAGGVKIKIHTTYYSFKSFNFSNGIGQLDPRNPLDAYSYGDGYIFNYQKDSFTVDIYSLSLLDIEAEHKRIY